MSDRTNERTNEFFINEGKGISTIYFFSSSPRENNPNQNIVLTIERERDRQTDRQTARQTDR